jgi:hypothetical protein
MEIINLAGVATDAPARVLSHAVRQPGEAGEARSLELRRHFCEVWQRRCQGKWQPEDKRGSGAQP